MPCDGERADGATARAADSATRRVVGQPILLPHFRQQFFDQEAGVLVVDRVVLLRPIVRVAGADAVGKYVAALTGRDEDADGDRDGLRVDEVLQYLRYAERSGWIDCARAILEDEHVRRRGAGVLRRNVNPVAPDGARDDLAAEFEGALQASLRDAVPRQRIRCQRILPRLALGALRRSRRGSSQHDEQWQGDREQHVSNHSRLTSSAKRGRRRWTCLRQRATSGP